MLNTACSPFSSATCLDDREEPLLELALQIVLQLLSSRPGRSAARTGCRAATCRCPSRAAARAVSLNTAAPSLSFACIACSCLVLSLISDDLLRVQVGQLLRRLFAGGRRLGNHLNVHERDLRPLREWRGRLRRRRGRRRRGRGRRVAGSPAAASPAASLRPEASAAPPDPRRSAGTANAGPAVNTNISASALSDIFNSFI